MDISINDFCEIDLHDTFVIVTIFEGEVLTLKKATLIRKKLISYYRKKDFVMISNRTYNLKIEDEVYKQGQLPNMKGLAIVSQHKTERVKTKQNLPISLQQAWDFLSDPKNLKTITPDYMGFKIISGADRKMYSGQLIQYIVTPLAGIKTTWVTEITHAVDKEYFVDEQRFGPYALWHHKHFIKKIPGGVEMEDIIDYKVPFGILGQLVHPILVKPKLKEIFDYREQKLIELFGAFEAKKINQLELV